MLSKPYDVDKSKISSSVEFEILQCNITLALSRTFIEHWAYAGFSKGVGGGGGGGEGG